MRAIDLGVENVLGVSTANCGRQNVPTWNMSLLCPLPSFGSLPFKSIWEFFPGCPMASRWNLDENCIGSLAPMLGGTTVDRVDILAGLPCVKQ